jgi:hypothetical protein
MDVDGDDLDVNDDELLAELEAMDAKNPTMAPPPPYQKGNSSGIPSYDTGTNQFENNLADQLSTRRVIPASLDVPADPSDLNLMASLSRSSPAVAGRGIHRMLPYSTSRAGRGRQRVILDAVNQIYKLLPLIDDDTHPAE